MVRVLFGTYWEYVLAGGCVGEELALFRRRGSRGLPELDREPCLWIRKRGLNGYV